MFIGKVKIRGVKPIVFHKFNIEVITSLTKNKSGSAGNNPEEWKKSFYHEDGKIYMPDMYVFSCLKNASVYTKAGRGSIQKTWISAVQINPTKIFLDRQMFDGWENIEPVFIEKYTDPSLPVYIDIRMVSNPNTKGKNVRYRVACSPDWTAEFDITIDDNLISKAQAAKVIEDGGKLQGIADLRTLGYGRYEVQYIDWHKA